MLYTEALLWLLQTAATVAAIDYILCSLIS